MRYLSAGPTMGQQHAPKHGTCFLGSSNMPSASVQGDEAAGVPSGGAAEEPAARSAPRLLLTSYLKQTQW